VAEGEIGPCAECGNEDAPAITFEALAEIVDPVFRSLYRHGDHMPILGDDDRVWYRQAGGELSDALGDLLNADLQNMGELIDALAETEGHVPGDPDEYFYDDSMNFDRMDYFEPSGILAWQTALEELKRSRRFFSASTRTLFDRLFSDVDSLYEKVKNRRLPVVRSLAKGTTLYRARVCRTDDEYRLFVKDPLAHIGPPPSDHARDGRMNAKGVTVLYCARDVATCLAEMRPAIGMRLLTISVKTNMRLRILDFTRLERAWLENKLGHFHEQYFDELDRQYLLMRLHNLISQPVTPDREEDYLITQTMAEYLAHVHEEPFDGIAFGSAQRAGGVNVVLFPFRDLVLTSEPAKMFPIEYVKGSLSGYQTESIVYRHTKDHTTDEPVDFGFDSDNPF